MAAEQLAPVLAPVPASTLRLSVVQFSFPAATRAPFLPVEPMAVVVVIDEEGGLASERGTRDELGVREEGVTAERFLVLVFVLIDERGVLMPVVVEVVFIFALVRIDESKDLGPVDVDVEAGVDEELAGRRNCDEGFES